MKKLFFVLSAFMFISVGLYYYNIYLTQQDIKTEVNKIYKSVNTQNDLIDLNSTKTLPFLVSNYLQNVISSDSNKIQFVTYNYRGNFIPSMEDEPMMIDGKAYYNITTPSFIWQGRIKTMNILEKFIHNKGSTKIEFLDLIAVVDRDGNENNKAQYLRWLIESVLYPTNLLLNDNLRWESIDKTHAKLITRFNNIEHTITVKFENGLIKQLTTNRFYGEDSFKQWIVEVDDYKIVDSYKIPTRIKMSWKIDHLKHTYLDYFITKIDYNKAP
jgi:hypothetical protein